MPIWGDREITWRQILPPAVIAIALVCLALVLRGCLRRERADVDRKEQFDFYIAQLSNPDPAMVPGAVRMLGELGDKRAIEAIRPKLAADDPRIVGAACEALGRLGDEASAGRVLEFLGGEDPHVVVGAAIGLGALHHKEALQPLLRRLHSPDFRIRSAAVEALGLLGDPAASDPLTALRGDPAAGLQPVPTEDQRADLAQTLAEALGRLEEGQGR